MVRLSRVYFSFFFAGVVEGNGYKQVLCMPCSTRFSSELYDKKKTHDFGGNDDENGNFSDALFLHPNIIETEILSS